MRRELLIGFILFAAGLSACTQSGDTPAAEHISVNVSQEQMPVLYDGTYTLGGPCDVLEGTMTITEQTIRITETICTITDKISLDSSSTTYSLSKCVSEGARADDRKIIIKDVEDGQVSVNGWSAQTLIFDVCS